MFSRKSAYSNLNLGVALGVRGKILKGSMGVERKPALLSLTLLDLGFVLLLLDVEVGFMMLIGSEMVLVLERGCTG